MFSTKGVDTVERSGISKYLSHGINKAKIVKIEVVKSHSSEARKVEFYLEGEPINDPKFEGVDKAKGKVGKMSTFYMSKDDDYKDFIRQIGTIADKLGVRAQIDEAKADNIEGYISQVSPWLTGRFLWWNIGAEEYAERKYRLSLLRYGFVKALSEIDEASLTSDGGIVVSCRTTSGTEGMVFDKTKKYHFKPFVKPEESSFSFPSASSTSTAPVDPLKGLPTFGDGENGDLPF